ncbi:MAG: 3'(2'),5'-bisphosphate nucleotidase CysQ [Pseudomonadota bacterium]
MTLPLPMEALLELARRAGAAILEIYNTDFSVTDKADNSPLTEADLASHKLIVSTLEQLTPEIPVLSEESAKIPFETRRTWRRYWLIDPLDGTKEFVKRNGEFTVNIALIEDQRPTLGVIYAPVIDKLYYGVVGEGAWMSENGADLKPISVAKSRRNPTLVAGSRSHAGESLLKFLTNLGEHELLSMGSSLKSCLVAEGKADLYPRLGLTSEWDTGAAQAIVEAAGGQITMLDMQPLRYNTKDSLLNPYFFVFGDSSEDWSRFLADS